MIRYCPNGHSVDDDTALRCSVRGCGAWVEGVAPNPTKQRTANGSGLTPGVRLILLSVLPGGIASLGFFVALNSDIDAESSRWAVLWLAVTTFSFVSSTLFFIGCIAEGVRLGNRVR